MSYQKIEEDESILEELPTKNEVFDIYENHRGCFCTDFYCLVIFLLSLIAMVVIFIVGFKKGDPRKLISPLSFEGDFCGIKNGVKRDFPYLFMPNFPASLSNGSVCVDACPTPSKRCILSNGSLTDASEGSCEGTYAGFPNNDTISVLYRCVPNLQEYLGSTKSFLADRVTFLVSDLQTGWWLFLVVFALTIVLSIFFLCFVRFCSRCIIWGSIATCVLVVLALGVWLLVYGFVALGKSNLQTDSTSAKVFIGFGFVFIATAVLLCLLACCCLHGQINLAAGILSEASRALGEVWSIYFAPLFYLVIFALFVAAFATTLVYYCSGFDITTTDGVKSLHPETAQRATVLVAFFIFLWVPVFLVGCNQATIAGAASAWYFTRQKENLPSFAAGASALTLFLHHTGSVAVGSFLIALVYFVRAVVLYLDRKMKEEGMKENRLVKCLCCCANCCLACISRVLEFITSSSYIVMSIYGRNFFSSASTAVHLLGSNPVRSVMVTGISHFVVLCLELCVTAITTIICVLILQPSILGMQGGLQVYNWWFMAFACFVFALALTVFAFHIYSFLVRVVFMCFLIDEELSHKNGQNYTHYASTNLVMCMDDCAQLNAKSAPTSGYSNYSSSGGRSNTSSSGSSKGAAAGNVDY